MKYSVKCTPIKNGSYNVVGLASVVIDDKLMVSNIQLVERNNNFEVHYPSRKSKKTDTGYMTIAYPADQKLKRSMLNAIIKSYKKNGGKEDFETDTVFDLRTNVKPCDRDSLRGLCRVSLSENDEFCINDIMLREGSKGIYIDFPSYRTSKVDEEGKTVYNDVISPFSKEFYAELKDVLIANYEDKISMDHEPSELSKEDMTEEEMPELAGSLPFR